MEVTMEEISKRLVDEALKDPDTGWPSDLAWREEFAYDSRSGSILLLNGGGSIDVGHLAYLVSGMIREAQGE